MSRKRRAMPPMKTNPRRRQRPWLIASVVLLALVAATGSAGALMRSTKRTKSAPGAAFFQTQFNAASPSKEYIYAGGRLVATEEPTPTPPNYQGNLDSAGCDVIEGWAWDANNPGNTPMPALGIAAHGAPRRQLCHSDFISLGRATQAVFQRPVS